MEKVVIIGSAGAGKSTLARKLGSKLNIKVVHLDRVFWQRGWKRKTRDTRIDILQELVREKQWIIEGNYFSSSELLLDAADTLLHLDAADTIIFLDIPPLLCLQRVIKRHFNYHGLSRRDIPEGCTDKLTLRRMWKVLTFPLHGRRTIKQKLCNYNSKQIIWLHSSKEVEEFLAQQEQDADDNLNKMHEYVLTQ
jgi:adenylate kinase family enzyme